MMRCATVTVDRSIRVWQSADDLPAVNLALEEWLFRGRQGHERWLLVYRNAPCVVIGRNQNPWLECDLDVVHAQQVTLVRRISGGGTVYHDPGNLNCAFVLPRDEYDPEGCIKLIAAALQNLGLPARQCKRHTIWVGERKVAGSAFMLTGRSALLHVCLLVNADLTQLRRCLTVPPRKISGKAVESVRAPVANLAETRPDISSGQIVDRIVAGCGHRWNVTELRHGPMREAPTTEALAKHLLKHQSWEWTFGRTPEFWHEVDVSTALGLDSAKVVLRIKDGVIADAACAIVGGGASLGHELGQALAGRRYAKGDILSVAEECPDVRSAVLAAAREIPET